MRNSNRNAKALAVLSAAATLAASVQLASAQSVWNAPNTGNWSVGANWTGGVPASGATTTLTFNASGGFLFGQGDNSKGHCTAPSPLAYQMAGTRAAMLGLAAVRHAPNAGWRKSWKTEVTLVRRDVMGFRMLLGRRSVRRRFLVDCGRSFVASELLVLTLTA